MGLGSAGMWRGRGIFAVASVLLLCAAPGAQAAFPGANGKIAYTNAETGARTINPDGTGDAAFGEESGFFVRDWSPDGTLMLGERAEPGAGGDYQVFRLWTFPAEGGSGTLLGTYDDPHVEISRQDGAWSPDGGKVVYTGLEVINADGTNPTPLGVDGVAPVWSSDGAKIAYMRWDPDVASFGVGISTVNMDGTGVTDLTSGINEGFPDWSPDGQKIVFDAAGSVVVMNRDGSGRTTLVPTSQFGLPTWPVFSPDGTKIAWMNWSDAPENEWFAPTLWVMNSDGSGQTSLGVLGSEWFHAGPSWQPIPISNQPPDCSGVRAQPDVLWPPNHKLRTVELSGASDADGDETTLEVTGVTQDEPAGVQPDAFVREGGALLRAERDGRGDRPHRTRSRSRYPTARIPARERPRSACRKRVADSRD